MKNEDILYDIYNPSFRSKTRKGILFLWTIAWLFTMSSEYAIWIIGVLVTLVLHYLVFYFAKKIRGWEPSDDYK